MYRLKDCINLIVVSFFAIGGFFVGVTFALYISTQSFDGGIATLLGSACGAALTVVGSLWVAQHQSQAEAKSFLRLVVQTLQSAKREAKKLIDVANRRRLPQNLSSYAYDMGEQLDLLSEALDMLQALSPYSQINDYEIRIALYRLDDCVREKLRVINKERKWLENPTKAVIRNSQDDLFGVAYDIFDQARKCIDTIGGDSGSIEDNVIRFNAGNLAERTFDL